MDMIKIGKFIALKRKEQNLTQMELAEKLNITDRAISKWECGRAMPDSSIMLELCEILHISVNELLTGEVLEMKDYNEQAEKNLINIKRQKEESDKRILIMEIALGVISVLFLFVLILVASYFVTQIYLKAILIASGFVQFLAAMFFAIRIEQKAGYYECKHCHAKYIPMYNQVLFAMHVNRTRYMKCPHCNKWSWQKKVITDEKEK